jgi:mRNA interferase MazF
MYKEFDKWNKVKKRTEDKKVIPHIKYREIYWANVGENIGFEQNGKGDDFLRPLLIFKKFSNNMFFGIPLSSQRKKEGNFFFEFSFQEDTISTALIVQGKLFDVKRLERKIGKISLEDYKVLKEKFRELFDI